jgi:hypothetical protein
VRSPSQNVLFKRPTSAQSRANRAAAGGAFSSLLAGRKYVPVQKAGDQSAWRRARLDFPKIRGGFSRRGNDTSKVVYYNRPFKELRVLSIPLKRVSTSEHVMPFRDGALRVGAPFSCSGDPGWVKPRRFVKSHASSRTR